MVSQTTSWELLFRIKWLGIDSSPAVIALYFISVSPVLWWALARALYSSTYRGFKVGQDNREREAPLVRSTAGFWPAKIYQRQVLLKKPSWTWETSQFDSSSVSVFQHCTLLFAKLTLFSTLLIVPYVPLQGCDPPSSDVEPFPSLKFWCCFTLWVTRAKRQ